MLWAHLGIAATEHDASAVPVGAKGGSGSAVAGEGRRVHHLRLAFYTGDKFAGEPGDGDVQTL